MDRIYKHVILVGIDGAGNFYKNTDTPTIRRMFEKGVGTDYCLTSMPSISAECWGSMLIGVYPDVHKLTNEIVETKEYTDSEHPTVFKLIRNAIPDAVLASYSNWDPINTGIIEKGLNVALETGEDPELTVKICDYIKSEKPDFLFVQLDSMDSAGHHYGYNTEKYLEQLKVVDSYLNDIWNAVIDAGIADDTLFIATADHGGINTGHGGDTDEEKYVFFAAVGKTAVPGSTITLEVKDIPAIVTSALGVPGADNWAAVLPDGIL